MSCEQDKYLNESKAELELVCQLNPEHRINQQFKFVFSEVGMRKIQVHYILFDHTSIVTMQLA